MAVHNVSILPNRDLRAVEVGIVHGGKTVKVCGANEGFDVHVMAVFAIGVTTIPDAGCVCCACAGLTIQMVLGVVDLPIDCEGSSVGNIGVGEVGGKEVVLVSGQEGGHTNAWTIFDLKEFIGVDVPDPFVEVAEAGLALGIGVPLAIGRVGFFFGIVDEGYVLFGDGIVWSIGERSNGAVVHHVEAADTKVVIMMSEPFFEIFRLISGNDADGYILIDVGLRTSWVDF